jgi:Tim44-like domain
VWTFKRKQGVQSRTPDTITREGCPNCGAPFERTTAGRCTSCDASLTPGESDWFVQSIRTQRAEGRPPLLGGYAEEVGTDLRTVFDRQLNRVRLQGEFSRDRFLERARTIFLNLQQAWSDQNQGALRPYETESLYQSHRFWLEEYKRQGVRNLLTQVELSKIEIVKIAADAAYEAVTCRMHASMIDVTVKGPKRTVVGGDASNPREFTEYWTFLRRPGAKGAADDTKCPNCGAPLKISQAGVCEYCQAVITRGEFDWVLTRIEQDEDYTG